MRESNIAEKDLHFVALDIPPAILQLAARAPKDEKGNAKYSNSVNRILY
jgi:hypothetical protein